MIIPLKLATLKPDYFSSLRLSRREKQSSAKKREHNANRLSVDMHEDLSSSTSNEPKSEEVEAVEIVKLSDKQKDILRETWKTIYGELGTYCLSKEIDFQFERFFFQFYLGQTLCYVGCNQEGQSNQGQVGETFLRLFEEYPTSQQFFSNFRGTSVEALRDDVRLSNALQEHAVRVLRVIEKVIVRLEDLEKVSFTYYICSRFHP